MYLVNDYLVFDFPYHAEMVNEIKGIVGAKWDKVEKLWKVPLTSISQAREFALKHNFNLTNEIMRFTVSTKAPSRGIYASDGWVYMKFPYERVMINAVKKVPQITWDSSEKAWKVPVASAKNAVEWADGFSLPVDDEVRTLAVEATETLSRLVSASRSVDADISVDGLQGTLLPYQRAGVQYASRAKRTFIADEMGLGKTIQAIATVELANSSSSAYPAVVVCPPSLVLNWASEYEKWLPNRNVSVITNRKAFPESGYDIVVIGYSNITHWEKELQGHKSYIFDESHYCKTPTAQRAKSAIKMAKSVPKDGIILCLTGTPVTNRPAEYASQLDILGKLKEFGGLWGFYRRYCGAYQDNFGQWNISGHSNLDELNERLRGTCYIRRTKDQVLSELPPVVHSRVLVEGTPAGMAEYQKAEKDIIKYITDRAKEIAIELGENPYSKAVVAKLRAESNEHLVKLSVLRRLSAKAKMPAVHEWVEAHIADGKKVVVCAHHRDIVDELAKKYGNLRIQGGMSVEDVEIQKKKFMTLSVEEAPVIVLSIQAAKTGHTLTASQDCLFVELPWTPADVDQTYSRLHRLGQQGSVTSTYLLTSGTIDEEIYKLIQKKRAVVNASVDGGEKDEDISTAQLFLKFLER
jgi:SNF2 family DNA or RNA helicase